MPYADPEQRREYLREYKRKARAEAARNRPTKPPPVPSERQWASGHSDFARCLTCGRGISAKPLGCSEPRHHHAYEAKRTANNEYRRRVRMEARERGDVYRKGRGRPETKAAAQRRFTEQARDELCARLGADACIRCGFADKRALQFDHKNGGGARHRREVPGGNSYLRRLLAMPIDVLREGFQVLCANCNTIKRIENGEH